MEVAQPKVEEVKIEKQVIDEVEAITDQPDVLVTIATERSTKSKAESLNKSAISKISSTEKKSILKKDIKKKALTELDSNKEKLEDILAAKALLISEIESNQQKIQSLPTLEQELNRIDILIKQQFKIKYRLSKSREANDNIIESMKKEIWMLSQY